MKVVLLAVAIILEGDKTKADQIEVNMAGNTDAEIVIDVNISNADAKRLVLVIENNKDDELYRKEIDKKGFHSIVRFPKENNISEYKIKLKNGNKITGGI